MDAAERTGRKKTENGKSYSIAVLAGGRSRRMGRNKALAPLAGRALVSYVIDALSPLSRDLFIVGGAAGDYERFGVPHVADQSGPRASIVGVYSALAAARNEFCLVAPCDMPFVSPDLAAMMAGLLSGHEAVVPAGERGLEPLFAIYGKSCMAGLRGHIESGELALQKPLAEMNVRYVDREECARVCDPRTAFFNVNTKEDLAVAERELGPGNKSTAQGADRRLAPHEDLPPLLCIVGKKNSGKTTFIEKLVGVLESWRVRTAYIKHDVHGFDMDREGKDTWRVTRAGAREVVIASPHAVAGICTVDGEIGVQELRARIATPVDIVIAEGYKTFPADRIEISLSARSEELACREEDLLAVVSDRPGAAVSVPVFGMEDANVVARLIIERYGLAPGLKGGGWPRTTA